MTDDGGASIAGARVALQNYLNSTDRYATLSDANGRYQFDFPLMDILPGAISARNAEGETIQTVTWPAGTYTLVRNLRLWRIPTLNLGESKVMSIEPDRPSCVWEFSSSIDMLCAYFVVRFTAPTRVTVVARPMDGGAAPRVGWESQGLSERFSARFDFPSTSTSTLWMNVAIPRGAAPQRYEVATSAEP